MFSDTAQTIFNLNTYTNQGRFYEFGNIKKNCLNLMNELVKMAIVEWTRFQ